VLKLTVSSNLPYVSIIVPIRNESQYIERTLSAIILQDYPFDKVEIIVVDGESDDGTKEIVEKIIADNPVLEIHLINNPKKIVPSGLNLAIQAANGEIIVRVDGHTIIAKDYVKSCVFELIRTKASNVGGRMIAVGKSYFSKAVEFCTSSPFGVGGARFHYSNRGEWVDTVYLGTWYRDLFREIGLFDEDLVRNQDDEFNYRIRANKGSIYLIGLLTK
jgi:succinoglycan biosynthesis protein ExoA